MNRLLDTLQNLRVREAADLLDVSVSTLRRYADAKMVQSSRSLGGDRMFPVLEIYRLKKVGSMHIKTSADQLQGPRDYQQDHALLMPKYATFAVADGMGGMDCGELASATAVQWLQSYIPRIQWPETAIPRVMGDLIIACNEAVVSAIPKGKRGGTTLSMATFFKEGVVCLGHVGDSRIYRVRGGRCEQLTKDHATAHTGYILSCLGTDETPTIIQANVRTWRPGDTFLICSDGFSGALESYFKKRKVDRATIAPRVQEFISRFVNEGMTAQEMNQHVEKACELHDNSTVIRLDMVR